MPSSRDAAAAGNGANIDSPLLSLAVFAWNEEDIIGAALSSLFGQSLFAELSKRGRFCEITCVVNGCTDRTAEVAAKVLEAQSRVHPYSHAFRWRVVDLPQRGKLNAWNQFVHSVSARESEVLVMMDADIQIYQPHTIWNMVQSLEKDPGAHVAVDRPRKDIRNKSPKSLAGRLSLAMSRLTGSSDGQLCGQLYAIRSRIAREIFLPRDLTVEDGFIKALVCTDFLTHPVMPGRIRIAEEAEHAFEAYINPKAVLKNQKRQIIAQTIVHILIDQELQAMSPEEKSRFGAALLERDQRDPDWVKRLLKAHLERIRFFWRLYPDLIGRRFRQLTRLPIRQRLLCLPAALASSAVALAASFMAWRALRAGVTNYWPKAARTHPGRAPG